VIVTASQQINYSWFDIGNNTNITFISPENITLDEGTYTITVWGNNTDNTVATDTAVFIVVDRTESNLYFYIFTFGFIIILFILGQYYEDWVFTTISGMLSMVLASHLFFFGYPFFTNVFIINSLSIVFAGIGMYLTLIGPLSEIGG